MSAILEPTTNGLILSARLTGAITWSEEVTLDLSFAGCPIGGKKSATDSCQCIGNNNAGWHPFSNCHGSTKLSDCRCIKALTCERVVT